MISPDPIFQAVTHANKAEAIGLQIETAIVSRHFNPGDRLPSERALQEIFKTSRGAVREALRTLRQKGLLEAKKGAKGGYYVREVDINEAIDHLAVMIQQQQMPLEKLLEFQYAMDQAVLVSAVANATPAEIGQMAELAGQLIQLCRMSEPDFTQISAVDKKLNLLMVEMTKNPFFEWMMRSVQLAFRAYEFVVYETPQVREEIARNWQQTALAVQNRDLQKALGLYGHWYVLLEQCLTEKFGRDALTRGSTGSITGPSTESGSQGDA